MQQPRADHIKDIKALQDALAIAQSKTGHNPSGRRQQPPEDPKGYYHQPRAVSMKAPPQTPAPTSQNLVTRKEPKLGVLPKFNGSPKKLDLFFVACHNEFNTHPSVYYTEDLKIITAIKQFEGTMPEA